MVTIQQLIAHDFRNRFQGVMEQPKLDAVVALLGATKEKYPASAAIFAATFYWNVDVGTDSKTFVGHGGGSPCIGAAGTTGEIRTADLKKLYTKTVSFQFQIAYVYASVLFFDDASHLLGHYQSGGGGNLIGTGGGRGSWGSKKSGN